MAHPYHHSLSSVRKWGGSPFDYLPLHSWFDLMWTGKSFFSRYSAEVVVPVVHRRGPAVRVARIDAQAERTAGRCLWTHRGERPENAITLRQPTDRGEDRLMGM